jgi:threonine/homoserine/homoserine lactone efflux protein
LIDGLPSNSLLGFVLTSTIIEITPGPNMAYLAALSLAQGRRAGIAAVAGIALGLSAYGLAVGFGLGTAISNSVFLYESLRWAGVVYLLWLAWDAWKMERDGPSSAAAVGTTPSTAFHRGLVTNLLNPKAAVFYIAILPEFVRIDRGSVAAQTALLSAVYVTIATVIHLLIVLLASHLQARIETPASRRTIRRVLAILLAGIAIWFAVSTERG